mgnify:CR=1 FL=1
MKLVIVDRDGTLCVEREGYLQTPDDWAPLPGALEAIARLSHAGWHVVIASNQSGVGRGLFDVAALNAIHGLFQVTERVYQVRGMDISNMTIIEGDTGLIVIDPLLSVETARAALALYRSHRGAATPAGSGALRAGVSRRTLLTGGTLSAAVDSLAWLEANAG